MASGGVEFGDDDTTPLLRNTDDQDDGDEAARGNETTGFEPGASSTPAPNGTQRQTTMNRPGEQPSFDELPDTPGLSTTFAAKNELLKYFPDFDENNIKYKLNKNDKVEVGLAKFNKPYYPLITKIPGSDEYRINPRLTKEILKFLGKSRMETLEEEMKSLRDGINENKEVAENPNVSQTERNKARERAKRQIEALTDKKREHDKLKSGNFSSPYEFIKLETFQKNTEERQEIFQEKQLKKEEQFLIINDENSSPAEKERASEKVNEIKQEQNEIEDEQEREIEQLPLRDRLREKVKAIFKKYSFTVTAVLLAVGTTLGVVLSSLSNGLKGVAKEVGNGLKTLGKKIADILPGLLGAVVSFVFRTAGNVIGSLGKHAWLLILAVAAFLFERVMKRRG